MPNIIDTSYLIQIWQLRLPRVAEAEVRDAKVCADELIRNLKTNALVMPVVIEFLAGVRGRHELELADKFLSEFAVLDDGNVVPSDWQEARRLARRVPQDGTRRQLGDCLIRAIANRLRADVLTLDEDFPG